MKKIKNVELFTEGIANDGRKITSDRISELEKNTKLAVADGLTPKVKFGITHKDGELVGNILNINKIGNSLVGDLEVTKDIYNKIKDNGNIFDNRSVELAKYFTLSSGETLPEVLGGVAIGLAMPSIQKLGSIFGASSKNWAVESFERLEFSKIEKKEKEQNMATLELTAENFAQQAVTISDLTKQVAELTAKLKGIESNTETFSRDEKIALEKELEAEKKKVEVFERDVKVAVIDELIKDGKVLPAEKDNTVEFFERLIKGADGNVEVATKDLTEHFSRNVAPNMEQSVETGNEAKEKYSNYVTDHSQEKGA